MDTTNLLPDGEIFNRFAEHIISKIVFINNINSFEGKYISKKLRAHNFTELLKLKSSFERSESISIKSGTDPDSRSILSATVEAPSKIVQYLIWGTVTELEEYDLQPAAELADKIFNQKKKTFISDIAEADYFIYTIRNELSETIYGIRLLKQIEDNLKTFKDTLDSTESPKKTFILLSTPLTWSETKKIVDDEEPEEEVPEETESAKGEIEVELPILSEEYYRKRRPHPCFTRQKYLEREVMNAQKRHPKFLQTVVLCPGITYGEEEYILTHLFKQGNLNIYNLSTFAPGTNTIPLIYIHDFADIIIKLIIFEFTPPELRYVLVVQPGLNTLKDLALAIAKGYFGDDGRVMFLPKSKMKKLITCDITNKIYYYSTINVKMTPKHYADYAFTMGQEFLDYMSQLIDEFRAARKLGPIKIVLLGPPCSGKTTLGNALQDIYKIQRFSINESLKVSARNLRKKIKNAEDYIEYLGFPRVEAPAPEKNEEEEEEAEVTEDEEKPEIPNKAEVDALRVKIKNWTQAAESVEFTFLKHPKHSTHKFPTINFYLTDILNENPVSENNGYILDGLPFVYKEAAEFFLQNYDNTDPPQPVAGYDFNPKYKPDYIFVFHASDEFVLNRVLKIPEAEALKNNWTEQMFMRSLDQYREDNMHPLSILDFFKEMGMKLNEIKVDDGLSEINILQTVKSILGPPKVYPLTRLEDERLKAAKERASASKTTGSGITLEKQIEEEAISRCVTLEEWAIRTLEYQLEEAEFIENKAKPITYLLQKFVLPHVAKGLTQVAKYNPEHPVEFLAHFLLSENYKESKIAPEYLEAARKIILENYDDDVNPKIWSEEIIEMERLAKVKRKLKRLERRKAKEPPEPEVKEPEVQVPKDKKAPSVKLPNKEQVLYKTKHFKAVSEDDDEVVQEIKTLITDLIDKKQK